MSPPWQVLCCRRTVARAIASMDAEAAVLSPAVEQSLVFSCSIRDRSTFPVSMRVARETRGAIDKRERKLMFEKKVLALLCSSLSLSDWLQMSLDMLSKDKTGILVAGRIAILLRDAAQSSFEYAASVELSDDKTNACRFSK